MPAFLHLGYDMRGDSCREIRHSGHVWNGQATGVIAHAHSRMSASWQLVKAGKGDRGCKTKWGMGTLRDVVVRTNYGILGSPDAVPMKDYVRADCKGIEML